MLDQVEFLDCAPSFQCTDNNSIENWIVLTERLSIPDSLQIPVFSPGPVHYSNSGKLNTRVSTREIVVCSHHAQSRERGAIDRLCISNSLCSWMCQCSYIEGSKLVSDRYIHRVHNQTSRWNWKHLHSLKHATQFECNNKLIFIISSQISALHPAPL